MTSRPQRVIGIWSYLVMAAVWPAPSVAQQLDVGGVGYVLGDADAAVDVVEFGDFACSACAQFWRESWPLVRTELIESGRVRWRHVPFLLGFDRGDEAANAAECAAEQEAFWAMHDRLFERQAEWTRIRRPEAAFRRYASELGLAGDEFAECYDDRRGEDRTEAATRAARRAGVRGTPTFYVNGIPALGALPFDHLLAVVEEAEERAGVR